MVNTVFSQSHSKHVPEPRTGLALARPCLGFCSCKSNETLHFLPSSSWKNCIIKTILIGLQKRMVKATCKRATGDSSTLQTCYGEGIQDGQAGLLVYLHGVANWPTAE